MINFRIEPITGPQILGDCAAILTAAYNAEPWNDNWTPEKALEKLQCFYDSPRFLGWTAWHDETLTGCCVGNIEPYFSGDYFYLKEMFVSVEAQGKGAGAQLLAAAKSHLATLDINAIILFTGKDFFPFDFYLKHGFNEMENMRMMHFESL